MRTKTTMQLAEAIGTNVYETMVGGPILVTSRSLGVSVFCSVKDWALIQASLQEDSCLDHLRVTTRDAEIICGAATSIAGVDLFEIAKRNDRSLTSKGAQKTT